MSRNGPPRMAGFFSAETWIWGDATNDCISFTCALATNIAEVCGAIR
jgi:hypothetical protein